MESTTSTPSRRCSPALAAGAGMAVCLTSSVVVATNGNVSADNGGDKTFTADANPNVTGIMAFGGEISFDFYESLGQYLLAGSGRAGTPEFNRTVFNYIKPHASGVAVSAGMAGTANPPFKKYGAMYGGISNKYLAVRFDLASTIKYGWIEVLSSSTLGNVLEFGAWSYNSAGGSIDTLGSAVVTRKLLLSNGKFHLSWSSRNEAGVARYEVQRKDTAGLWRAVDSDTPGQGNYTVQVSPAEAFRLHIEYADGSTATTDF